MNKASAHQKNLDVGANIFIGNLDPEVDEKLLYDTFSAFGVILQTPKVRCWMCVRWLTVYPVSHVIFLPLPKFEVVSCLNVCLESVFLDHCKSAYTEQA